MTACCTYILCSCLVVLLPFHIKLSGPAVTQAEVAQALFRDFRKLAAQMHGGALDA